MKRNWHIKINNFLRLQNASKAKWSHVKSGEHKTNRLKAQIETKHEALMLMQRAEC